VPQIYIQYSYYIVTPSGGSDLTWRCYGEGAH